MRAAFQLREDLFERGMRVHAHAAVGGGALAGGLVRCAFSSAARFWKRTVLARMAGSGTGAVPVAG